MGKGIATIDYEQCMACWCCVQSCPLDCLKNTKTGVDRYKKVYPELKEKHGCTGCGICAAACPVDCITIRS